MLWILSSLDLVKQLSFSLWTGHKEPKQNKGVCGSHFHLSDFYNFLSYKTVKASGQKAQTPAETAPSSNNMT